jgi:hypothetical protein
MRTIAILAMLTACDGSGGDSVPQGYLEVGFNVQGASNSTCTLVAATGADAGGQSMTFSIGAPSPAVANTDLSPSRSPARVCTNTVTNGVTVGGPVAAVASRTSTDMCFQAGDVRTNLGFDFQQNECPITLTLTCEGVVLYDHIPWSVCH